MGEAKRGMLPKIKNLGQIIMGTRIHRLFAEMVDLVPSGALLLAIKLEQGMLEDDLIHCRIPKSREVVSILNFCSFIEAAAKGREFPKIVLPLTDIVFYRNIIRRLVDSGELPPTVKSKFDFSFYLSFWEGIADH
jgi:hypothetical protein